MIKLQDVIYYYIGCDCEAKWHPSLTCTLVGVTESEYNPYHDCKIMCNDGSKVLMFHASFEDIKPILRKLSSMTEDEARELDCVNHFMNAKTGRRQWKSLRLNIKRIPKALSLGFDLFGLLDSGQAIEKKP